MAKRTKRRRTALAALFVATLLVSAVAWATELIVTEKSAVIRRDKRSYAPKVAVVAEGDKVRLLEREEPWLKVEYQGLQGWLKESSVSDDPKVVLSGEAVASGVRATEQSAAGRGFTPEIEREYRASRPQLDAAFKFLDSLEKKKHPEEEVVRFLTSGQLTGGGGE
jgi:hypothetical protein